jgi:hypothetical protein
VIWRPPGGCLDRSRSCLTVDELNCGAPTSAADSQAGPVHGRLVELGAVGRPRVLGVRSVSQLVRNGWGFTGTWWECCPGPRSHGAVRQLQHRDWRDSNPLQPPTPRLKHSMNSPIQLWGSRIRRPWSPGATRGSVSPVSDVPSAPSTPSTRPNRSTINYARSSRTAATFQRSGRGQLLSLAICNIEGDAPENALVAWSRVRRPSRP